jgi:biofilm PGA synthesis N-glycosyltransferase PgaC
MHLHGALLILLATVNVISLAHLGLYITGANLYDIKQYKRARQDEAARGEKKSFNPLVSVIIPARNESAVIARTINSVRASSYKQIEIIVVDDGSTDDTAAIIKDYIYKLPTVQTRSYVSRRRTQGTAEFARHRRYMREPATIIRTLRLWQRNAGKAAAMNNAIINEARGELIMCLDADSILHRDAIKNAVAYFRDEKIIGVAANVRVLDNGSWLSKVQRFEHMIGYRAKKFYSLTNSEFIIGGVASTYRRSVLQKVNFYDDDTQTEDIGLSLKLISSEGNRHRRIVYAANVVAMTEGVQTFQALLRQRYRWKLGCLQNLYKFRSLIGGGEKGKHSWLLTKYRLPMAILNECMLLVEPILLGYIIYLSVAFHTVGILLGAYLTITSYVLLTLWPDEHLTVPEKFRLTGTAGMMYGLFFVMDIVQIAAIFRCLWDYEKVIKRSGSTWVSPARSGARMVFSR